jgi:hypothetical protein
MKTKYHATKINNLGEYCVLILFLLLCFSCSSRQERYSKYSDRDRYYDNRSLQQPRYYDNNRHYDPYYGNPPADSMRYSNPYEFYYPKYDRDAFYTNPTSSNYYSNDNGGHVSSR